MDFIQTTNKQVDKFGAGKHGFSAGNPSGGIPATFLSAEWHDNVQQELVNVIEGAGIAINPASKTQLQQAIQAMIAGTTGNDYKASVRAATVGSNITLAGGAPNTLDGVTIAVNDRILVKDQTTGSQNGIYVVTTLGTGVNGTWTRAIDADQAGELTSGSVVAVEEGTLNADSFWMLVTDGVITIGTTVLIFARRDSGAASGQQPGEICFFARNTAPTGFLKANGAAVSRTTYAALFAAMIKTAAVAISIATPGVVTWNSHGLSANDPVKFTTTGALPTGLVVGTTYYVVGASITTNTFQLSATAGGAAIATSGAQSGAHNAINSPFGDGDGSTTFNVPDLRGNFPRGWDDSAGADTNRSYGSLQLDAMQGHLHTQIYGAGNGGNNAYGDPGRQSYPTTNTSGPVSDGTNGTPRTAAETRPRNVAMLACIKY